MARTKQSERGVKRDASPCEGSPEKRRRTRTKSRKPKSKSKAKETKSTPKDRQRRKVSNSLAQLFDAAFDWYQAKRDPYLENFPQDHPSKSAPMEEYLASVGYTVDTLLECLYDSNGACMTPLTPECQNKLWAYLRSHRSLYGYHSGATSRNGGGSMSTSSLPKVFASFKDITVTGVIDDQTAADYSEKFAYDIVSLQGQTSYQISKWDQYILFNASGLSEPKQRYLKGGALLTCSKVKEDKLSEIVEKVKNDGDDRSFEIRFKQACDKRVIAFMKTNGKAVKKGYENIFQILKTAFASYISDKMKAKKPAPNASRGRR